MSKKLIKNTAVANIGIAGIAGLFAEVIAIQYQLGIALQVLMPLVVILLYVVMALLVQVQELKSSASAIQDVAEELLSFSKSPSLKKAALPALKHGEVEVYLSYAALPVHRITNILHVIDDLYDHLYLLQRNPDYFYSNNIQYGEALSKLFNEYPEDILSITDIHTGNSVHIRVASGRSPGIEKTDKDTYIYLPKGIATASVLGGLLIGALEYGVAKVDDIMEFKERGLRIEQLEIQNDLSRQQKKKLILEIEELERKLRKSPPEAKERIEKGLETFLTLTQRSSHFDKIEVSMCKDDIPSKFS